MIKLLGIVILIISVIFIVKGVQMLSESGNYDDKSVEGAGEKLYNHTKNRDLKVFGREKLKKGLLGLIFGALVLFLGMMFGF